MGEKTFVKDVMWQRRRQVNDTRSAVTRPEPDNYGKKERFLQCGERDGVASWVRAGKRDPERSVTTPRSLTLQSLTPQKRCKVTGAVHYSNNLDTLRDGQVECEKLFKTGDSKHSQGG